MLAKEDTDDLDALLADLLPEEADETIELPVRAPHPAHVGVGVSAIVLGNEELAVSVRDVRTSCRAALDAVMQARDALGEVPNPEDRARIETNAWLACMDELIVFCDRLCGVLLAE